MTDASLKYIPEEDKMANHGLSRAERHKEHIDDVCLEISQTSHWRALLFSSAYDEKILIDLSSVMQIPEYIRESFRQYDLKYYVSKIRNCPEAFDPGLEVFKFEASEYPDIIRYSGNNI
jgi:hypothetical protein